MRETHHALPPSRDSQYRRPPRAQKLSPSDARKSPALAAPPPSNFSVWGGYLGHGGDTYGFLSEQGIIGGPRPGLGSFSVVANEDSDGNFVRATLACRVIVAAAKVLLGEELELGCRK